MSFVLRASGFSLHRMDVGKGENRELGPFGNQWLGWVERRAVEVVVEIVV